jgi:hypothetical protein
MAATEPVYISYLNYIGSGAPADGDQITRDNSQYPLNTVYTDRDSGITYVRKATTKVAATDWQAGGGTATEVTVYQLKTIITDAQIKAMPTTSVELIPAPGEGKMIVMYPPFLKSSLSAGAYGGTNVSGDYFAICYSGHGIIAALPNSTPWPFFNTFFAGGDKAVLLPLTDAQYDADWTGMLPISIGSFANYNNRSIIATMSVAGGDLTGGDPANTIDITLFYSIVDL